MDTRRSYYLAPRQDDFDIPAQDDEGWVDFADIPYVTPDPARVESFQDILRRAMPCFIRKPRGLDIFAACGQLKRSGG